MRVISGLYRGASCVARAVGPPTHRDRLKETVFNILGPGLQGSVFVDAFSGTGSIGIEALSRGANEVVFIESGRKASH